MATDDSKLGLKSDVTFMQSNGISNYTLMQFGGSSKDTNMYLS